MLRKKDYVIYSIFTYIVLILLIYLLRDSRSFKYVCSSDSGCVRFCCDDADTCNEEFIKKNFNESLVPTFLLNHDDLKPEFKIFYGKPICKTTLVSNDTAWMFAWVRNESFLTNHQIEIFIRHFYGSRLETSYFSFSMEIFN